MKDDGSWDREGKYIFIIAFVALILTLFGIIKGCADGELFNSHKSSDPTMRPIGHGY